MGEKSRSGSLRRRDAAGIFKAWAPRRGRQSLPGTTPTYLDTRDARDAVDTRDTPARTEIFHRPTVVPPDCAKVALTSAAQPGRATGQMPTSPYLDRRIRSRERKSSDVPPERIGVRARRACLAYR